MTRIRYKNDNGFLVSKPILAGTDLVEVVIHATDFTFQISKFLAPEHPILSTKESILFERDASTLTAAKRLAKAKLKELGAVFSDEVRTKWTPGKHVFKEFDDEDFVEYNGILPRLNK